jgi:hypothetical protein
MSAASETVKDVQGLLRHSRIATTTDVYMQEIPESVQATVTAINDELRGRKPARKRSQKQAQKAPSSSQLRKRPSTPQTVAGSMTPNLMKGI